jgi:SAM-dependent methyltransferase
VAELVGAEEIYGIDVGDLHPSQKLKFVRLDAAKDEFPFADEYFDLITAIELIEHLPFSDNFFAECFRVLRRGGYLLITTPNLASWLNRVLLLFGYQTTHTPTPSRYYVIGLPSKVRKYTCISDPWDLGHVCGYTLKGLSDMLAIYNFFIISRKFIPYQYRFRAANWLERFFSKKTSLAGGLLILAEKR